MRTAAILYPMFALAAWTALVLMLVPLVRARSALRRELGIDDFKFGESSAVPQHVSIPNRNYMNLLEQPVLFYVVCLLLFVTAGGSPSTVLFAWCYVALRVVHSCIHLTYNRVVHRLAAFAVSTGFLVALWIVAALRLANGTSS